MEKGTKKRLGREFWCKTIKNHAQSGQSIPVFCRENGLTQASFYQWRKRLSEGSNTSDRIFTAIEVVKPSRKSMEVVLPGGLVLRFDELVPVDYLRQISAAYVEF